HSVRVPLMVIGPNIAKNKRNDARVYLQDIMATSLELSGAERPDYVQFKSLLPLLNGTAQKSYEAIYGAYTSGQRMVTEGDYKLILYPKVPKTLLYNVKEDPHETRNLADLAEYGPTIKKLFKRLLELQKETGDSLDLRQSFAQLSAAN
ncbi:MAG: sulfatase/phosphatase domain-containing protein, partial [Pirellulales bacterium]